MRVNHFLLSKFWRKNDLKNCQKTLTTQGTPSCFYYKINKVNGKTFN